ncbi:MAG: MBL fold metallo-hydrolase [Pseudomonadota bacterium]
MPNSPIAPAAQLPDPWIPYGQAHELIAGIRCVLARNPSPLTGSGTNSYLLGHGEVALIDPGPEDPAHLNALLGALEPGEKITHIFVTHAHKDHSEGTAALKSATGAPVYAFGGPLEGRSAIMTDLALSGVLEGGEGVDHSFAPDILLKDGEGLTLGSWRLTAHWTPGHFGNHLAFEAQNGVERFVFSGDIVMGWATSLVSPPDGDLSAFFSSCEKLLMLKAQRFFAGHGAPIESPSERIKELVHHRKTREAQILASLAEAPGTKEELTERIYRDVPSHLWPAAARNVLAHLIHLSQTGKVTTQGPMSAAACFELL